MQPAENEQTLTRLVGEHGLANGTRPHPELRVLGRFRVAGQVFAQTALVHVVLAAHRTRMVGRPTFGHVRPGTDVSVACQIAKTHAFSGRHVISEVNA